jgi:hypothetical protein
LIPECGRREEPKGLTLIITVPGHSPGEVEDSAVLWGS